MLNQPTGTESITRHVLESYNLTVPAVPHALLLYTNALPHYAFSLFFSRLRLLGA